MLQYNPTVSGSLSVTGTITATQGITGSFSGSVAGFPTDVSAFSASLSTRITATESTSSEYVTTSGSLASRVALTEATASQFVTASGSLAARLTSNEAKTGSFATTGSNFFIGTQVVTGSVYITSDLVVQGSSSLQNITASAVSVGTNTIILNTATPILQFGGISVQDSGSTMGRSGSLLWNSINDHWINVNPSGSDEGYNSAMVINGPKNTGSLGQEVGLTTNYIPVSQGEDHITDSIIFQSGSTNIGIGTTVPTAKLDILASSAGSTANILRLKNASNDTSTGLRVKWDFQSIEGAYLDVTTNSGGSKTMTVYLSSANATPVEVFSLAGSNKSAVFAGNVGIGTTPSAWVSGWFAAQVGTGTLQNVGAFSQLSNNIYYNGTDYKFITSNGASRIGLNTDGEVFIGTVGSGTAGGTATLVTRLSIAGATGAATFSSSVTAGSFIASGASNIALFTSTGTSDWGTKIIGSSGGARTTLLVGQSGYSNGFTIEYTGTAMQYIFRDGYVGIGTTGPGKRLEISEDNSSTTSTTGLKITNWSATTDTRAGIVFQNYDNNGAAIWSRRTGSTVGELIFGTNSGTGTTAESAIAERMRITSGGDICVGITSALQPSSGRGTISINGSSSSIVSLGVAGSTKAYMYTDGSSLGFEAVGSQYISLAAGSSERMRITGGAGYDVIIGLAAGNPYTASGRGSIFLNGSSNALYGWGTGGTARGYMYHNGTNVYLENSTSGNSFNIIQVGAGNINFGTNGATRMTVMGGGGIGTGQSANGTPLRATLVKTGTTSITFNMSMNTIGAWRPGFATVRVSGAQNGLQEYWMAWYIIRLTGYFGSGLGTAIISSGGDTGAVSLTSSSDQNSPQAFSITVTDSGGTTNTMIADLDVAYHEGIISLT